MTGHPRSQRVCIVGNSGSGKTHLARRAAQRLGLPHLELDALNHRPGWQEAPLGEFRAEVRQSLAEFEALDGGWVVDGNYRTRVADLVNPDTYVWLDYSRRVVLLRLVRRTAGRVLLRRELWNGNRENWRNLLSRDPMKNILVWSWTQHAAYRANYTEAAATGSTATWVQLRSPAEADEWLRTL